MGILAFKKNEGKICAFFHISSRPKSATVLLASNEASFFSVVVGAATYTKGIPRL